MLLQLETSGDYAATIGSFQSDPSRTILYVSQFSSGRLWTITPTSGTYFAKVLAVSSTEVVALDGDLGGFPNLAPRLLRLSLQQLDSLAAHPIP